MPEFVAKVGDYPRNAMAVFLKRSPATPLSAFGRWTLYQDKTNRRIAPGYGRAAPSSLASEANRVRATELLFAETGNRLLQ
jgi:hypothetical protein